MGVTRASAAFARGRFRYSPPSTPRHSRESGNPEGGGRRWDARAPLCQNQDLQDWRDLQDFTFAQLPLFAIKGIPAKTIVDERFAICRQAGKILKIL